MTEPLMSIMPLVAKTTRIALPAHDVSVALRAARYWKRNVGSAAEITDHHAVPPGSEGVLLIETGAGAGTEPSLFFSLRSDGSGILRSSHPRWLYFLAGTVLRNAARLTPAVCEAGVHWTPPFPWCRNLSDLLVGSQRSARGFSAEEYCEQLALQGFTHVTVNGLGTPRPFESGPPGDMYFWFYDYSPDLDQFVDSSLIRGYYPSDYLSANLAALKRNAALVRQFGLVPGLHINAPRSMPEEFWNRNGHLRGARVDHPRETFRPRYSLAMAHPAVQEHYRDLLRAMLREVPDLGFIHVWTNDSGAGFEFVTSLYAGRNGGPYLLREWKSHDEIARAAAGNVLTFYRLLRDEARNVNPEFRVVCDLAPFFVERPYIIPGLGNGLDAGAFGSFEVHGPAGEGETLAAVGAWNHEKTDISHPHLPGLPYPGLVYERLTALYHAGARAILCATTPQSIAPFDINGDVLAVLQADPATPLDDILTHAAARMAGSGKAAALVELWMLADAAVRGYPADIPLGTFAFPWFRLWVRPFVPDIEAIPEGDRAYYERFLLATFNNPARVDLNADMLWNYLTVEQAAERVRRIDTDVFPPLDRALGQLREICAGDAVPDVFVDLEERLRLARTYYGTMRNSVAWTEAVHGYRTAHDAGARSSYREKCTAMVDAELANARDLLALWRTSCRHLFPVSMLGESLHIYGENFGELLERKIALMERHRNDVPKVDEKYMWREKTD